MSSATPITDIDTDDADELTDTPFPVETADPSQELDDSSLGVVDTVEAHQRNFGMSSPLAAVAKELPGIVTELLNRIDESEQERVMLTVLRTLEDSTSRRNSQFARVVRDVRQILGARLVAYIAQAGDTADVASWEDGSSAPDPDIQPRLRVALAAARTVERTDGARAAQSWFMGRNWHLDSRAPARVLREDDRPAAASEVLSAARAFSMGA